jgi:hypothetical protein
MHEVYLSVPRQSVQLANDPLQEELQFAAP